jgi:hypothetical protein
MAVSHIINLAGAKIDALEVKLGMTFHVDVGAVEAVFNAVNGEDESAFFEFDGHVVPCVERKERCFDRDLLHILFDRQGGGFFTEGEVWM